MRASPIELRHRRVDHAAYRQCRSVGNFARGPKRAIVGCAARTCDGQGAGIRTVRSHRPTAARGRMRKKRFASASERALTVGGFTARETRLWGRVSGWWTSRRRMGLDDRAHVWHCRSAETTKRYSIPRKSILYRPLRVGRAVLHDGVMCMGSKGILYEKGEAPHSADRTGNTLRMGSVTHYQDGDSVLNKHTSNPLRASTSLHSKNLLSHARLTQPPTVYLNPWGKVLK